MSDFMRSQPLDRISSAKRRSTTSEPHHTFNSLFRRLSNGTNFSSFGRIQGRAKGRSMMSRNTNGERSGSSKRSTSEQTRDQEFRPVNGLDINHSNGEEPENPAAILASCNEAIQRLAHFARFLKSFDQDFTMVEGVYGREIDREIEIQRLQGVVKTLTHAKDERLENLQREIEELKASEKDCIREREKCKTMQIDFEEQYARSEAEREKRFQKSVKVKSAEIEAGSKEKTQDLENQIARLSATTKKLEQNLSAADEKLEKKRKTHARVEKSLEEENEKLKVELKQMKSDFPLERHSVQYYAEKFQHLSQAVEDVSFNFFRKLPERAIANPDTVREELSKLNPIFASTPIWESQASEFLRLRAVQHVISTSVCDFIWQPFFPQDDPLVGQFLEAVSKSLSVSGKHSESPWRVLTLRGINALADAGMASRQVDFTVHRVLEILQPLTIPSQLEELKQTLVDLVKESVSLWAAAQKDTAKVVVEARPNPSDNSKWYAEDSQGFGETSTPSIGKIDVTDIQPLCIFPNIIQLTSPNKSVLLHRGSALFPTSQVWIRGMVEQKEHEEELAEAVLAARSKVNARRTSCTTGPNSPMRGKFSTTQN